MTPVAFLREPRSCRDADLYPFNHSVEEDGCDVPWRLELGGSWVGSRKWSRSPISPLKNGAFVAYLLEELLSTYGIRPATKTPEEMNLRVCIDLLCHGGDTT